MIYIIKTFTAITATFLWALFAHSAFAQLEGINDSISTIGTGVSGIIVVLISGVFLFFIYNLIVWMVNPGKEGAKEKVLWSVVSVFLVTSIWGITTLLGGVFNLETDVDAPQINTFNIDR